MSLVNKRYTHKNDKRIEEIEVLQEQASQKVLAKVTYKKDTGFDSEIRSFDIGVLEEKK